MSTDAKLTASAKAQIAQMHAHAHAANVVDLAERLLVAEWGRSSGDETPLAPGRYYADAIRRAFDLAEAFVTERERRLAR